MAEAIDIRELNIRIEQQSQFVTNLVMGMNKVIVGQKHLVDCLLIGLLSDGHILLEGVPGLAKTLAIKTLSQLISADYSRIQFTPDLLPADVIGTQIYSQKDEAFHVKRGPVFANFVLADEINRAPAKVQSALLEAMQEHQVTIGEQTFHLPGNRNMQVAELLHVVLDVLAALITLTTLPETECPLRIKRSLAGKRTVTGNHLIEILTDDEIIVHIRRHFTPDAQLVFLCLRTRSCYAKSTVGNITIWLPLDTDRSLYALLDRSFKRSVWSKERVLPSTIIAMSPFLTWVPS